MREILLHWVRNDYRLLRHVLTTILKNPDIRLSLWSRPGDTEPAPMTAEKAAMKLIRIALPSHVEYEGEFNPLKYVNGVYTKIRRLNKIYYINLYPESRDHLMRSDDYRLIQIKPVWALVKQLSRNSPAEKDRSRAMIKPPGERMKDPNGASPEQKRAKAAVTLPRTGGNGSVWNPPTRTESTSYNLRPTRSSANYEPNPSKIVTLKVAAPFSGTPRGDASRAVRDKKRPALDPEGHDSLEERKLEKAREHELALINARIRLVEAETELAKAQGDHQKEMSKGSVL